MKIEQDPKLSPGASWITSNVTSAGARASARPQGQPCAVDADVRPA